MSVIIPRTTQRWRDTPKPPQDNPLFSRDPQNEQTATLAAGATFTGKWTLIDNAASFLLLYGTNQPFTMRIEWSKDGIVQDTDPFATTSPQVRFRLGLYSVISSQSTFFRPYYRMKITNGPVAQAFVVSDSLLLATIFPGYQLDIDGPIPILGLANLNHALGWGRNPTEWKPLQLTALNNTKMSIEESITLPVTGAFFPANQPVTVTNFPAPIPPPVVVPYSKYYGVGTGLKQTIKIGPGTLHSIIVSGSPKITVYDDLLGLVNKFIDIDAGAQVTFIGPIDIPFTTGLTVNVQNNKTYTIIYL